MKKCTYCGMENSDTAQVCEFCFSVLPAGPEEGKQKKKGKRSFSFGRRKETAPADRYCPVCGSETKAGEAVCEICGAALNNAQAEVYCPACDTMNSADAKQCVCCGMKLKAGSSRVSRTVVWIGAAVAAAILVVMGLGWIKPAVPEPVIGSVDLMTQSLIQRVSQMSRAQAFLENSMKLWQEGEFGVELELDTQSAELSGSLLYSRERELLSGQMEWDDTARGIDTQIQLSADDEVVMFSVPDSPDIYGCDLDEFGKTTLAGWLPVDVSSEMLKNLYREPDASTPLGKEVEESWQAFVDSIEYEEISESLNHPELRAFQISWDPKAARKLMGDVTDQTQSGVHMIDGADNMAANLFGEWGTGVAGFVMGYMEEDCRLYINSQDQIEALDFTIKPILGVIGEGDVWTIRFADPSDPWTSATLTSQAGTASGYLRSGADGAQLELDINVLGMLSMDIAGIYDDASGDFSGSMESGELRMGISGRLTSGADSAALQLSGNVIGVGQVEIVCGLRALEAETPGMISSNGKYVDITDSMNWERMKVYLLN